MSARNPRRTSMYGRSRPPLSSTVIGCVALATTASPTIGVEQHPPRRARAIALHAHRKEWRVLHGDAELFPPASPSSRRHRPSATPWANSLTMAGRFMGAPSWNHTPLAAMRMSMAPTRDGRHCATGGIRRALAGGEQGLERAHGGSAADELHHRHLARELHRLLVPQSPGETAAQPLARLVVGQPQQVRDGVAFAVRQAAVEIAVGG